MLDQDNLVGVFRRRSSERGDEGKKEEKEKQVCACKCKVVAPKYGAEEACYFWVG